MREQRGKIRRGNDGTKEKRKLRQRGENEERNGWRGRRGWGSRRQIDCKGQERDKKEGCEIEKDEER